MTGPANLVMGRPAVVVTATCVAVAALAQLLGSEASNVVDDVGGRPLDAVWSASLVLGWLLIVAAVAASRWVDEEAAIVLERVGAICFSAGVTTYVVIVWRITGIDGAGMAIGLCTACVINMLGRQALVWRRARKLIQEANRGAAR